MVLFIYLLRGVLLRTALALPTLALLYLVFHLGDQGRVWAGSIGWSGAVQVGLLHLPLIAVQVAPVALLFSIVMTLTSLRQRGELEALATFGASPARLWAPLVTGGLLLGASVLALDELVVPICEREVDRRLPTASSLTGLTPPSAWMRQGAWFYRVAGQRMLALEMGQGFRPVRRVDGIIAPPGVVREAVESSLGQGTLRRRRREDMQLPRLDQVIKLRRRAEVRAESMDLITLARHLRQTEQAGQTRTAEALVLHTKLAFPLLNVVVAILGGLFALRVAPRPPVRDLAWATLAALGLWVALAAGWVAARSGWLTPAAGVWGPVVSSLALALALCGRGARRWRLPC